MYCVKCKKRTETTNERTTKTKKQQTPETRNVRCMRND